MPLTLVAKPDGNVDIERFGAVLAWFGPLGPGFFDTIKNTCMLPGFQGQIATKETETYLANDRPGTYLIRFSSEAAGYFTITVVVSEKKLNHFRILHRPGGKYKIGDVEFNSLEEVVLDGKKKKHKKQLNLGLKTPMPRTKYEHMAERWNNNPSISTYKAF